MVKLRPTYKRRIVAVVLVLQQFFFLGCGGNYLSSVANQNAPDALYNEAKMKLNAGDYSGAIAVIENRMSAAQKASQQVIDLWAGAYASRCGVTFLTFLASLQAGGNTPFKLALSSWTGVTMTLTKWADCEQAITLINTLTTKTTDESLFMTIMGLAKIGAYLQMIGDANHDGLMDDPNNACNAAVAITLFDGVTQGLITTILNIASTGTTLSGISGSVGADCTALGSANCNAVNVTTNAVRTNIKVIIDTNTLGVGNNDGLGNGVPCAYP